MTSSSDAKLSAVGVTSPARSRTFFTKSKASSHFPKRARASACNNNKYYDTKHRYEVNPYAYYEATTGGHVTVMDEAGNPSLDAYDPIELPFEYLERDWK